MFRTSLTCFSLIAALAATPLHAEDQVSFYSGWQEVGSASRRITGHPDLADGRYPMRWEGKPTANPPYWGLRWTRWMGEPGEPGFGWGIEFTHTKAYARDAAALGFSHMEMSDGLNIATINALWRGAPVAAGLRPYAGGGLGLSVPHFEATSASDTTTGYQIAGPALRLFAGLEVPLSDRWSGFAEAQATGSRNRVDFDAGGHAKVNLTTRALNLGVSCGF